MAKRAFSGLTLEEHRKFARALKELYVLAYRCSVSQQQWHIQKRIQCDLVQVCGEMDEHVVAECREIPLQDRFDVYFERRTFPSVEECELSRIRPVLQELIARLTPAIPKSKAIKHAQKLLTWMDRLEALETSQAS